MTKESVMVGGFQIDKSDSMCYIQQRSQMLNVCKKDGRKKSLLIQVIPLLEITKRITVISANLMLPEADLGLLQHPRWSF